MRQIRAIESRLFPLMRDRLVGRSWESNYRQPAVIEGFDAGPVIFNRPFCNSAFWKTRIVGREPPSIEVGRLFIVLPGINSIGVPRDYLAANRFS
jgi:hypothetical protein